jgi:hypothetical protein
MKAIETVSYEGKTIAVLVETMPDDETKAYVHYFIDGTEIKDWGKIVKRYQRILTALADNLCEGMAVIKWSY